MFVDYAVFDIHVSIDESFVKNEKFGYCILYYFRHGITKIINVKINIDSNMGTSHYNSQQAMHTKCMTITYMYDDNMLCKSG